MKTVALVAMGSLGDLHPFLGLAHELKRQGARPIVASSEFYRKKIEADGLEFYPVLPELSPHDPKLMEAVLDRMKGPARLHQDFIFPNMEKSLESFLPLARKVDVIISGILGYFVPIASELTGVPYLSGLLSPMCILSGYDPPAYPQLPWLAKQKWLTPFGHRAYLRLFNRIALSWCGPILELRKKHGLSTNVHPMLQSMCSPYRILGMFSKVLSTPQPDWPEQVAITGFIDYDSDEGQSELSEDLRQFLEAGQAPLVFTLGSSAIHGLKRLYPGFVEATRLLKERAAILVGREYRDEFASLASENIFIGDYAPYSKLFSKAKLVIHPGGIGTTSQVLRSGKPALILPSVNDQYDNAQRAVRLKVARALPLNRFSVPALTNEIQKLLGLPYQDSCAKVASQMGAERGEVEAARHILAPVIRHSAEVRRPA